MSAQQFASKSDLRSLLTRACEALGRPHDARGAYGQRCLRLGRRRIVRGAAARDLLAVARWASRLRAAEGFRFVPIDLHLLWSDDAFPRFAALARRRRP